MTFVAKTMRWPLTIPNTLPALSRQRDLKRVDERRHIVEPCLCAEHVKVGTLQYDARAGRSEPAPIDTVEIAKRRVPPDVRRDNAALAEPARRLGFESCEWVAVPAN